MNNTALSASVQLAQMQSIKTTHMVFRNRQHENINYEKSEQAKRRDCYHKVLMYIPGISEVTRRINLHLIENYGSRVRIFENSIPISVRAAEISAEGVSIYRHDPKGKVAAAY